jgi:drug/metabolite transporter (DMT)-like permease
MEIFLGLGAAVGWGVSDFCARFAGHKTGALRSILYMQPIGLAFLSLYLIFIEKNQNWQLDIVLLAIVLGLGNSLAGLCLFRAFEVGTLSVVSPVASSYGAIALTLGMLTGESPKPIKLMGLGLTLVGVILSSTQPNAPDAKSKGRKGLWLAIVASILFGVTFWGMKYVTPVIGGVIPVFLQRVFAPLMLVIISFVLRQSIALPKNGAWPWIIAVGVIDTLAFVAFSVGTTISGAGVISVLSSMFSAVTVLLAWIFLKERLAKIQWWGVIGILLGVGLISAG